MQIVRVHRGKVQFEHYAIYLSTMYHQKRSHGNKIRADHNVVNNAYEVASSGAIISDTK